MRVWVQDAPCFEQGQEAEDIWGHRPRRHGTEQLQSLAGSLLVHDFPLTLQVPTI